MKWHCLPCIFLVSLSLVVGACGPGATAVPTQAPPPPSSEPDATTPTETPPTETAEPLTPPESRPEPLPPEQQEIEFEAEDGTPLHGTYYPAAVNPAPVVILMHWARGDQRDWIPYALWLQNRVPHAEDLPLPPMPENFSVGVFTFNFRGFGEGGRPAFNPEGWLDDALTAVEVARNLSGVDPDQYLTIGASIGSDGAADSCGEGCLGALSLSPGSYLGVNYAEAVAAIGAKPVWCLASEGDAESAPTCRSATGETFRAIIYPGSAHGMDVIKPGLDPDVGQILFDFVMLALGL
jgi:hypothetical protein